MRRFFRSDDRGTAAVESAFLISLVLVPLVLGAVEFGFAFRDWLSVSAATREGARVGSAAGTLPNADCLILEATAGALLAVEDDQVQQVWIYDTNSTGVVGSKQVFRPAVPTDNPATLVCGTWVQLESGWPPASRDNTGTTVDFIGVRIVFGHDWITNAPGFGGTVTWQDDTIMRLEPPQE
jgi:Flp pilus assembly pilin Flp